MLAADDHQRMVMITAARAKLTAIAIATMAPEELPYCVR